MTINLINPDLTNNAPLTYPHWPSSYVAMNDIKVYGYENKTYNDTASALSSTILEEEFNSYELIAGSGGLAFWDEPEEDIYSFEDGEEL